MQLSFGGFHVIAKAVLATVHPLALAGLRILIATPLLLMLAWRRDRLVPARSDLPYLAVLGLLGVFANQLLFIIGLEHTTATNAAILMPSIPVFAVLVGAVFRIERIGPRRLWGIALAVAGALVLLDPGSISLTAGIAFGNLLILLNCLSYATFLVLNRPILERLPWRTMIAWAFLFGGVGVLAVTHRQLAAFAATTVSAPVWWGIAYAALIPTALAYSLNTWAVRRSSPSLVASYITLQPLVAAALASIFLGEQLGWREGAGFVLIAAGLWRVSHRPGAP